MKKLFCAAFSALFLFVAFAPCGLSAKEAAKSLAGKFNVAAAAEITAGTGEKAETVWSTADVDVSRVDTEKKLIAFTFDDAPNYTLKRTLEVFEDFNEKESRLPRFRDDFRQRNPRQSKDLLLSRTGARRGVRAGKPHAVAQESEIASARKNPRGNRFGGFSFEKTRRESATSPPRPLRQF